MQNSTNVALHTKVINCKNFINKMVVETIAIDFYFNSSERRNIETKFTYKSNKIFENFTSEYNTNKFIFTIK